MARPRKPRTGRNDATGTSAQDVSKADTTQQDAPGGDSGETPSPDRDAPGQGPDEPRDAGQERSPDTPADEVQAVHETDAPAPDADETKAPDNAPDSAQGETAPEAGATPATGDLGAGQGDETAAETGNPSDTSSSGTPSTEAPTSGEVADGTVPETDGPISEPDKEDDVTRAAATADATAQSTATDNVESTGSAETSGAAAGAAAAAGTARSDRAAPAPATRTEQITVRKGGFWSMLLGGVAAAAIGFAASPYVSPYLLPYVSGYLPPDIAVAPPGEDEGPGAGERLDAQAQRIADLEARIDDLPAPPPAAPDPSEDIAQLDARIGEIGDEIAALQQRVEELAARPAPQESGSGSGSAVSPQELSRLEDRIAALEDRPAPETGVTEDTLTTRLSGLGEELAADLDAAVSRIEDRLAAQNEDIAAQREDIDALRGDIEAQREDIAALQERRATEEEAARESARGTLRRAALTRIETALDTGAPLDPAIAELRDTGVEVPEALTSVAEDGVPTLAELQAGFGPAAREALAAVRSESGAPLASLGDFLRAELGIRSLEPREGDDPDAILSRAEAALSEGDLDAALTEIAALPEVGQAAFSDWSVRAEARRDALAAAAAISAELN